MDQSAKTALFIIGDVIILYFSLFVTLLIRYGSLGSAPLFEEHIAPFSLLFIAWLAVFYIHDLYELTGAKNTLSFYTTLIRVLVICFLIAVVFFYFIPFFAITPKRNLFIFLAVFAIAFSLWRQFANRFLKSRLQTNTILIGRHENTFPMAQSLVINPQLGFKVLGVFVPALPPGSATLNFTARPIEELEHLGSYVHDHDIRTLIVESSAFSSKYLAGNVTELLSKSVKVIELDRFEEELARKVKLEQVNELWFLRNVATGPRLTYDFFKRILDVAFSIMLLPFILAIGAVAAALIYLEDKGPVFYKQKRVGKGEEYFVMIKFRTMKQDAEKHGAKWTVENDPRITRVGRFLRKTRIDELPQIINILRGEMSFVGPRAEQPRFHEKLKKEIPFYERQYLIRPGATGWAQINDSLASASTQDTRSKLSYNFYYLKNRSLIFDIGIALKTINIVLRGLGR